MHFRRATAVSIFLSGMLLHLPARKTFASAERPKEYKCALTLAPVILDPRENAVGAIGGINLFITNFPLIDEKPKSIIKEPHYTGHPKYGAFRIGNGPRSVTYFSIDEATGFTGKCYVDVNQNGDLTDDGNGDWDKIYNDDQGRNCYRTVAVHASWGTAIEETEAGEYSLWMTKRDGSTRGAYTKITGRSGMVRIGTRSYPVVLGEGTGDGIFTVPAGGDMTRAPVTLYVDVDNDAPLDAPAPNAMGERQRMPNKFDLTQPFQLNGTWYVARPTASGASLTIQETTAPDAPAQHASVEPEKLPVGSPAPNIAIQTPDGKPLSLSDFKGKVVVLDLWATWCGPCQASMPSLEKLFQLVNGQDVVVLSVNVLDEKKSFDGWMTKHANVDYHFTFGFDPAGKGEQSVAKTSYEVVGIPAWFLISRDGKIAAKGDGWDGNHDKLIKALRDQGVTVKSE